MAERGYQAVCLRARGDDPLLRQQQERGVRHLWMSFEPQGDFKRTFVDSTDMERALKEIRPDLVVFSNCCPVSNFAGQEAVARSGIPFIVVESFAASYLADQFSDYLEGMARHYAQARAVIAVSQENLQLLHRKFRLPADKGQVIHYGRPARYFEPANPQTRQRLRNEQGIPQDGVLCFTSARLEEIKGYRYQLEAIERLRQRPVWPRLYFAWAGEGSLFGALTARIQQMGATGQVKLLGPRHDVAEWLDATDLFVLPSEAEGMPLAIMEAMARGVPIIASAVSGIPEELGSVGRLLPAPRLHPVSTINELAATLEAWAQDSDLRQRQGEAGRQRATALFREERMLEETIQILERALLPLGDYVSSAMKVIRPDACFPNMVVGNSDRNGWPYLRREVRHNWYVDRRFPEIGFLSRDEAHVLYHHARLFQGRRALEIGSFLGWSTCHLALAGVELDVIDPLLARPTIQDSVSASLEAAGARAHVHLYPGTSPAKVHDLAHQGRRWSFFFVDGDHAAPGPLEDALVCLTYAEADAMIFFHDLSCPDVAQGLLALCERGWQTRIYMTMQIMGVAWRGQVKPLDHQPDPTIRWEWPAWLPLHLAGTGSDVRLD